MEGLKSDESSPAAPIVGGVLVFIIAAVVAVLVIAVMIYWFKRYMKYTVKCGLIILSGTQES